MKEGKYREAGKLLARCFEVTEAPRYPLLLSEVFFALGKYEHANLLLRHGLETKGGFEALPGDVAAHFPSREVFEAKLKELEGKNVDATLLRSYLLLHAREPQEGFEILKDRLKEKPDDRIALRLYRRYLERTF
jgi:tetratricopeptide (TPR) repeat protein